MLTIHARNVNDAYALAMFRMPMSGVVRDTRNGKVMAHPQPVITQYDRPTERMLFDPVRDVNPFFHIFEGIWMLAGRNDVKWISRFNSNIAQFSDDGKTFHGAYGYRWRQHFDEDQIVWLIDHLKRLPNSRRGVIQMYDPECDHETEEWVLKDVPCNTAIYFAIQEGQLTMTVTNRSNDIVWGCYGANAVHMSMLQEFVANALGVPVGIYHQFSNDWHVYERHFDLLGKMPPEPQPYPETHIALTDYETWERDLDEFSEWVREPNAGYASPYLHHVLTPMYRAWWCYKDKYMAQAKYEISKCADGAIKLACEQWLQRRVK